jgi:hypothetical protein
MIDTIIHVFAGEAPLFMLKYVPITPSANMFIEKYTPVIRVHNCYTSVSLLGSHTSIALNLLHKLQNKRMLGYSALLIFTRAAKVEYSDVGLTRASMRLGPCFLMILHKSSHIINKITLACFTGVPQNMYEIEQFLLVVSLKPYVPRRD